MRRKIKVRFRMGQAMAWMLGAAQAAVAFTTGSTVQLPDAGLRFSPPAEIPMLPIPTPDIYPFTLGSRSFEACDAHDLWLADQMSALFTNALGRVVVARMGRLPPTPEYLLNDRYIRREDYARAAVEPETWKEETLTAWITAFSGETPSGFQFLGREQAMRYPARMYQWSSAPGTGRYGFLVRLPDPIRFVWFQFEWPGEVGPAVRQAMMQCLRSIVAGTTRAAGKQADLQFQHLAATGGEGGEYQATRRRVIENIQSLDRWWYVELPHYVLVSNLEKKNQRLVKELQANLGKLRERCVSWWAPTGQIREISVVRIFNTREEYLDYVGRGNAWTMGVWMPAKRELVVSPEYAGVGRGQILDTTYHEAFHQYIHYALDGLRIPTWLNEGHACLFEACRFTNQGRELRIDENKSRLEYLDHLPRLGLSVDIIDLMQLSPEQFYLPHDSGEAVEQQRGAHYASAWALVYFLRRGAPVACPNRTYPLIPDRIVGYLREHPNAFSDAVDHALDGIDRDQLRRDYAEFWESKRFRGMAKRVP